MLYQKYQIVSLRRSSQRNFLLEKQKEGISVCYSVFMYLWNTGSVCRVGIVTVIKTYFHVHNGKSLSFKLSYLFAFLTGSLNVKMKALLQVV